MSDTTPCPGSMYFMSTDGQLLQHACGLTEGHAGNHVCGCSRQWPRQDTAFQAWHVAHPAA